MFNTEHKFLMFCPGKSVYLIQSAMGSPVISQDHHHADLVQTCTNLSLTVSNRRHPTWSHELHTFEKRPRSRSLSVSRATQTREELEQMREMRNVKFTVESVECADEDEEMINDHHDKVPTVNVQLQVPNNTDL